MRKLPTGTVTFVFTDVEGSTMLIQRLGDGHREVLETHARLLRKAITDAEGIEVGERGDGFFFVFVSACQAAEAAAQIQRSPGISGLPKVRSASASGSTPVKVCLEETTTWVWKSIGPLVSATRGTADRSSFRKPRRRC